MPTPSTFIPDNAPKSFLPDEPEQIKSPSVTGPAEIDVSASRLPDLQATTRGGGRASLPDWRTGLASFGESVAEGLGDVATQPGVAEFIPQITPEPSSVQRLMESAGLRTPSIEQSPAIQAGVGAVQGVEELAKGVAGFFTSGPGLIQLGATATPIAPAVYLKWTVDMLNAGFTSVEEAWDAFQKSDWKDVSKNAAIAFGSFLGAGAAAKHGYKELTPIIEAVPKGGLMGVRVEEARQKALEATLPQKIEVENLRKNNAPATAAVVERISREQAESGLRETAPEASQGFDIRGLAEPTPEPRTVQPLSREQTEAGLREVLPVDETTDIRKAPVEIGGQDALQERKAEAVSVEKVPETSAKVEQEIREQGKEGEVKIPAVHIPGATGDRAAVLVKYKNAKPVKTERTGEKYPVYEIKSGKEVLGEGHGISDAWKNAAQNIYRKPKTETVTPSQDTPIGVNAAGEKLFQRADGSVYRMRNDRKDKPYGYPDFGGDLAQVETKPTPKIEGKGGARVRLAASPQTYTVIERLEQTETELEYGPVITEKVIERSQLNEREKILRDEVVRLVREDKKRWEAAQETGAEFAPSKRLGEIDVELNAIREKQQKLTAEIRAEEIERKERFQPPKTSQPTPKPQEGMKVENLPEGVLFQGVRPENLKSEQGKSGWLTDDVQLAEKFTERAGESGRGRIDVYDPKMLPKLEEMLEPDKSKPGSNVYSFAGLKDVKPIGSIVIEGRKAVFKPTPKIEGKSAAEMTPAERAQPEGQKKMASEAASVATVMALNKRVREKAPDKAWDDKQIQAATGNQSMLAAIRDDLLPIYNELYKKVEPKIEGMGGAIPEEFKPSQSLPTANKNASIDADRVARGESPLMSAMRKSDPALWDEAMRIVENDWQAADKLIARHKENPFTPTDTDVVILLQRRTDLKNTFAKLSREYAEASQEGRIEMAEAARASRDAILDQLRELESVIGRGDTAMGTMQGRAFRARRLAMNEDYSLASLIVDRESRLNRRLTQPEIAELEKISQDQAKISAELAKKEAELEAKAQEIEAKEIAARAAAEAKANAPSSYVINLVESIVKDWDARADRARARLRERMSRTSTGVDPTILIDLSEIGLSHLGHAGLNFAKWSSRMIDDVGEWARPHLQEVFKRSQKLAEADVEKRAGPKKAEVKERLAVPTPEAAIDSTITRLKKRFAQNPKLDFSQPARRIARYYVEQGITKPLELVDAVHAKLVEAMPELTKRETMDALSGYGRFIPLKKDAVSAALRDATGQMQQIAKLEDMASGIAPKKSGPERRVPSDEERRLIKQVEEKKKEGGYDVTDPETQLRTAMQAAERRFVNQIADLSHQINTRTKIIKNKRKLELDDKLKALRDKRDFLKEVYDEIFAPAPLTDAQRLAKWKERTQEKIIEYRERIVAGDFKPKQRPEPPRLDQEAIKLRYEIHKVHNALMDMRLKDDLKNRSKARKAVDGVANVIRFSRALMTGGEFSAVLRQGGFTAFSHPVLSAKALKPMFEALMSEQAQFRIMEEIQTRPNAPLYERNKLQFTESGVRLSSMEEHYMFRVSEKLGKSPLAKYPIKYINAFQRAYTTYLNRVRADAFDVLLDTYGDSPAMQKQIAELINVATGRGSASVGKYVGPGANAIFFAPRYTISRFQLLLGQPGWSGNAATRKMVAKEYAKALAGAAVVYSLGMMAGGSVEDDPRSPDFGKIKFGNTRIDPLFGLSQVTRLLATQATGERVDKRGREMPIRGKVPYGQPDAWDVASSFARTKLSPAVGAGVSLAVGKDPVGKKFKLSDALIQSATPITYGDILKAMEEQGVERGTAIAVLAMFGMGVQTYDANAKREE